MDGNILASFCFAKIPIDACTCKYKTPCLLEIEVISWKSVSTENYIASKCSKSLSLSFSALRIVAPSGDPISETFVKILSLLLIGISSSSLIRSVTGRRFPGGVSSLSEKLTSNAFMFFADKLLMSWTELFVLFPSLLFSFPHSLFHLGNET